MIKIETKLRKVENRYFVKNKTKYSPLAPSDLRELETIGFRFVTK